MPTAMSVASVPKEKFTTTDKQEDPGLRYAAWGPSFFFNEEMWRMGFLLPPAFAAGRLLFGAFAGSVKPPFGNGGSLLLKAECAAFS